LNEVDCSTPVTEPELLRIVLGAWDIESGGNNMVGLGRYVSVPVSRMDELADAPDALFLDMHMRRTHDGKRTAFCASPKALANAAVLPGWTHQHFRRAIRLLVERGIWIKITAGGKGAHDPAKFMFSDRLYLTDKGTDSVPNTILHPPRPIMRATGNLRSAAA
jgi:hypothetical protein